MLIQRPLLLIYAKKIHIYVRYNIDKYDLVFPHSCEEAVRRLPCEEASAGEEHLLAELTAVI